MGITTYFTFRKTLGQYHAKENEKTGRLLFRTTATLLALLLSFSLTESRSEYHSLMDSMESETSQLVDIYMDLGYYKTPEADKIKGLVIQYVSDVIKEDWNINPENPFDSRSTDSFLQIYEHINQLVVTNEVQKRLKKRLLEDIDEVTDFLQKRKYQTRVKSFAFSWTAIIGYFVLMILYSVYSPSRLNLVFISLYSLFLGAIFYFILMLNQPYSGPFKIQPKPFEIFINMTK